MKTKTCSKCGVEKDVCLFYKNCYSPDGLRSNCKECQNKLTKKWQNQNVEKANEIKKRFKENNPGRLSEYSKKWKNKNLDTQREYSRNYRRERYNQDTLYKLQTNYRNRLKEIFRDYGYQKKNRSIDYLGCDIEFLKKHLESLFTEGMSWDNKGFNGWHIDHIIPLSSAKSEEEIVKLFHYTNLQPLWAKDNISKGSKIF